MRFPSHLLKRWSEFLISTLYSNAYEYSLLISGSLTFVSEHPPEILSETGIDIPAFKEKFCANGSCFIMRAKNEIEHIFSELYSVPDRLQRLYFKLKVQELLLFLSMVDVAEEKQREYYTSPQVEIVKQIHKRLISDL